MCCTLAGDPMLPLKRLSDQLIRSAYFALFVRVSLWLRSYLYKKSREGKWQKRWFETNGCFLTYYKNRKMEKLLAALSLPQVGAITLITENDPVGKAALQMSIVVNVCGTTSGKMRTHQCV